MKAIVVTKEGAMLKEIQKPSIRSDEVLVKVKANALNRADLTMINGAHHDGWGGGMGLPLGLEWAGEIVEVGEDVKSFQVGDRVMSVGSSAFAEYIIGNPLAMYHIPDNMTFEQAATLPVAMQTMHDAIVTNGNLTKGQTVLFQGATSAMGLIGMQIAKYLGAGKVIGTSRSEEKCAKLLEFGADIAVNTSDKDWVDKILKSTDGKGADLVIDFLAGSMVNGNLQATRVGGRIVNVGRMAGENGQFDFGLHCMRRITYIGASFKTRTLAETVDVIAKTKRDLSQAMNEGAFNIQIDKVYPFEKASEAFERMDKNDNFGKIVLLNS